MLRLLSLLAGAPDGLRAGEVARALGKSSSTAYSLLDTLVQEGFVVHTNAGMYHLAGAARDLMPAGRDAAERLPAGIAGILDELFERTRKRVYLAAARSGQVVIPLVRGRQGMPCIPGLGSQIGANAHALALGKIALSLLDDAALARYFRHGLKRFTPATITDGQTLLRQLDDIQRGAVAFDVEEFSPDFCCLALPVRSASGRPVAALGVSMSARCFELERDSLSEVLRDVAERASRVLATAGDPAIPEDGGVLERDGHGGLRSRSSQVLTPVHYGEEVTA